MTREILIYAGAGTGVRAREQARRALSSLCPESLVRETYAEELRGDAWHKQTRLLVMPGGRDVPYFEALRGDGDRSIREFVQDGGSYLGLCAGAYYGCSLVDFDRGAPFEVIAARELGLYSGAAIGPAYGVGTFRYDSDAGAKATAIDWQDRGEYFVYYDGGCYFQGEAPNVTVRSRYLALHGKPPAIIECQVGGGRAILSGVHPEFGSDALGAVYQTPSSVIEEIAAHEEDRWFILRGIMGRLQADTR